MADERARKSPNGGFEYSSPYTDLLTADIVSEITETIPLWVAGCDESESETRRTPEKLLLRDLSQRPDSWTTCKNLPYHNSNDLRH